MLTTMGERVKVKESKTVIIFNSYVYCDIMRKPVRSVLSRSIPGRIILKITDARGGRRLTENWNGMDVYPPAIGGKSSSGLCAGDL
jgi:hypothetical protein